MNDRLVTDELLADFPINATLVRAEVRISRERFGNNWLKRCGGHVRDVVRSNPAATLHKRHDGFFRWRLAISVVARLSANERLVRLDELTGTTDRVHLERPHCFGQPMAHEPCCFQRNA